MPTRIFLIGKNKDMPRVFSLPLGVRPDGTIVNTPVRLQPNEELCPECRGYGEVEYSSINPSIRDWTERCDECSGSGIVEIDEEGFE